MNSGCFKAGCKLVAGVGYNDGTYPSVKVKEHALWRSMLARCYKEENLIKKPAYRGCSVFNTKGWSLDKDLLFKGNKSYSEDTCVFVPIEINNVIVKADSQRGDYPIGVFYDKERKKFQARMWVYNKPKFLGRYETVDEAFQTYKTNKEKHIKGMAETWKDVIDFRAYEALVNYKVEITD